MSRPLIWIMVITAVGALLGWPAASPTSALSPSQQAAATCPALPPPDGLTVNVGTVSQLENAVNNATPGLTILVADGVYNLNGVYLRIDTPNVTLRSASGNRQAVILDGNYQTTEIVQVVASNVTIADLTLREAYYHPIHVMSGAAADTENILIYNVHIIDPGEQAVKINPADTTHFTNYGVVACSRIELTDAGRAYIRNNCYTGGIDAHKSHGWVVRDNTISGFWCDSGLSEHGIHFWVESADTLVERNQVVDCARGIGFGLGTSGHSGGIIRNNMVQVNQDVGIGLESSPNTRVYNNTVYNSNDYMASIEYRFTQTSGASIINNLANKAILKRDGASATLQNNLTSAQAGWFTDAAEGDLHLASKIASVVDQGQALAEVADDFDGAARPIGPAYDIGADEYGLPTPPAVADLHLTGATASGEVLTVTLAWSPPAEAVSQTLRYSSTLITEANWSSATPLAASLPGSTAECTADLPYHGGTVFFAHKSYNAGGASPLSNPAFWPQHKLYLPAARK